MAGGNMSRISCEIKTRKGQLAGNRLSGIDGYRDFKRCTRRKPNVAQFDCGARKSSDGVPGNRTLFLCRGWKNGGNLCTQSIGINNQFAMRLAHALSHSPNPDAHPDALRLNLCESFLRHSPTVILNLRVNLFGLASNAD